MEATANRFWSFQTRVILLAGFITSSALVLMDWLTADRSAFLVEQAAGDQSLQALQRFTTQLRQVPEGGIPFEIVLQVREML